MPQISPDPVLLRTLPWADYALLDSGHGRKLERYGPYTVIRPEPQCGWAPRQPQLWDKADAVFDPSDEDEAGHWRFARPPKETWPMQWNGVSFHGRFTSFRHLAVFAEQAANWAWQKEAALARPGLRLLNLFGYTGVASLVAARAGARVTHVDASKKAIGWARDNAALSGLEDSPIRWICEDARKYVQREVRRGSTYDAIILDPPKYGRGPNNEVWRLFEDLPEFLGLCTQLLAPDAAYLLLNAYAARISGPALAHMMADALKDRQGRIDFGELTLVEAEKSSGDSNTPPREIGLSFFARWMAS